MNVALGRNDLCRRLNSLPPRMADHDGLPPRSSDSRHSNTVRIWETLSSLREDVARGEERILEYQTLTLNLVVGQG